MYERLRMFSSRHSTSQEFYFAKVDVQSAFDTIPQPALIELLRSVARHSWYATTRHAEVKPGAILSRRKKDGTFTNPSRRWHELVVKPGDSATMLQRLEQQYAPVRKHTVFVGKSAQRVYDRPYLISLVTEHVENNIVKIGKKYYRQKNGIPQGSVLSSTLCNYFYADLERRHLDFLRDDESLLMRLVDDFLLITTNRAKAVRFVETMHAGIPTHGVTVNPAKTMVSFRMKVDDRQIAVPKLGNQFPYCGALINRKTLAISKDRQKAQDSGTREHPL
jgi:telomerase reverse transcriptase